MATDGGSKPESGHKYAPIILGGVVTLATAGSAPWWWVKLFPERSAAAAQMAPTPTVQAVPAPTPSVPRTPEVAASLLRYRGMVSRMAVDAELMVGARGQVSGYWMITNDARFAGQRFRLEGSVANGRLALREYEGSRHSLDIDLSADRNFMVLRGRAVNQPPRNEIWDVQLLRQN